MSQFRLSSMILVALLGCSAIPAMAQDAKSSGTGLKVEELTPEERKEREARKSCKVAICAAFRNRKPDGDDISCDVIKSWRKEQLNKMVERAKVSWPWGRVKCTAPINLKRDTLIKAMTEPAYEATLDTHKVVCEVEREKDGNAEIKFDFTPKVHFEKGKATNATLNWGAIEAPTLVKGAMWTATATDNTFNVLQSTIVEDIND
ncbi:MAG: hypothetical protein ACKVP3_15225, partial [Hyphomicrobiaceae bacterium]